MKDVKLRGSADGYVWVWRDGQDDHLALGGHEMGLRPFIEQSLNPNLISVVVGSHVGAWAVRFAAKSRKVYAYEANPDTYLVLEQNIYYNSLEEKVFPVSASVWDAAGIKLALVDENGKSTGGSTRLEKIPQSPYLITNSAGPWPDFNNVGYPNVILPPPASFSYSASLTPAYKESALSVTLDNEFLDRGKVGFILIDTEGAEGHVLRGARNLIERDRPVLLIELHEGHVGVDADIRQQVSDAFEGLNYDLTPLHVCPTEEHIWARPSEQFEDFTDIDKFSHF